MTKLLAKDGEGERLDRFELIAELASGGMATVFLARLSGVAGFQRLVAIKRLHPHLAREPEFVEMFLDEARLAARIHHPNVVPIQEVGESEQGYYLVMDYVEGDTLARILAKGAKARTAIPHGVTIRILLDVLAGLHAAHEMKDDHGAPLEIVHRDVSPQNILIGVDGVARVVDFGVARAASRLSTTRSGQLKGKIAYMAPEQARGDDIDRRADLFACGIVLWEALAMKRLFKGGGEAETLNRVLYDAILPPSSVRADVPKTLEAICMKALSRDVKDRYANAQELGDELEKAARALSCVGSVRDVSKCLESVIGVDLSEQRDAVRAWLARSEPSHSYNSSSNSSPPRSKPVLDSIVTRVDGGLRSERPPPISSSPEKVSSVSSAVIQVPDAQSATGPNPVSAARPPPSRSARVAIALAAAIILLGVAAWGAKSYTARAHDPAKTANATPATPSSAGPEISSPQSSKPPEPTPSASVAVAPAPTTSVATPAPAPSAKPASVPGAARPPVAAGRPRPAGSAKPATNSAVPDDLSHNPYR